MRVVGARGEPLSGRTLRIALESAGLRCDGRLLAEGGRVLGVTALGRTVSEAQSRAYQAVDRIDWPHGFCRRDIGWRAVGRRTGEARD